MEVDLRPETVDINVYQGDPWSLIVTITALGDLTNASITTAFKPDGGAVTTLQKTDTDLPNSKFSIGQTEAAPGRYDVTITPDGGLARTYLCGTIKMAKDVR